MRPPRALPAAHFDRNERCAYFGDRTLGRRHPSGLAAKALAPAGRFPSGLCSLDIWQTEIVLRRSKIFIVIGIQIGHQSRVPLIPPHFGHDDDVSAGALAKAEHDLVADFRRELERSAALCSLCLCGEIPHAKVSIFLTFETWKEVKL